ncbi:MAG: hypothetical protein C4290_14915 [Chloroflexota bacterium]
MDRIVGELRAPHTQVHRLSRRFLEPIQDVLVLGLGIALFGLMGRTLVNLFWNIIAEDLNFREVVAEVLFVLVLVELVRMLIIYLQEHRVAVDFMVELGIVSSLREIVLRGVVELHWEQIVALSLFLLALGALLRFGDLRVDALAAREARRAARLAEAQREAVQPEHVGARRI